MQPLAHAALRVAFKMKIFETFEDDKAFTINEISSRVGVDSLLLGTLFSPTPSIKAKAELLQLLSARIMRALASVSIFLQENEESYAHTASSRALMSPTYRELVICWYVSICWRVKRTLWNVYLTTYRVESIIPFSHLPDYLSSINYRNPDDPDNSLFHYASGSKLNVFQFMQTRPDMMETFSKGMAAWVRLQGSHLPGSISALFPSDTNTLSLRDLQGSASSNGHSVSAGDEDLETLPKPKNEDDRVLLVDVGGGRGSILQDLRRMRPDLRGRLIVQDLAKEIDGREISEGVEGMAFDFMMLQPVKGRLRISIPHS